MPSSVVVGAVAVDEGAVGQLVGDREDRRAHPLVVGRQEAHERQHQQRGVELVGAVDLGEAPRRRCTAFAQTSSWISLRRVPPRVGALASRRAARASRAPRSAATQHMTLENVKCWGSPRISQMPWSGSRQHSSAVSTAWTTIRHERSLERVARLACARTRSRRSRPGCRTGPGCTAALPMRTGRLPDVAREVVELGLGRQLLAVDRVEDLEVAARRARGRCRRGCGSSTSPRNARKSSASVSKPSACRARSVKAASRTQVKR